MSSTSIYQFKPTFLYIKQHTVTGKLYFGKTTKNPETYLGSGKYWRNHIKKHGIKYVINLWYCLFLDESDCKNFALSFSEQNDIVESSIWANLINENVSGGGNIGKLNGMHKSNRDYDTDKEKKRINNMRASRALASKDQNVKSYSRVKSEEERKKISDKAKHRSLVICPHCGKECNQINAIRHHLDRCKSNPNISEEDMFINKVTRIHDRKLMQIGGFAAWIKCSKHLP
jgi:hypothetical protein